MPNHSTFVKETLIFHFFQEAISCFQKGLTDSKKSAYCNENYGQVAILSLFSWLFLGCFCLRISKDVRSKKILAVLNSTEGEIKFSWWAQYYVNSVKSERKSVNVLNTSWNILFWRFWKFSTLDIPIWIINGLMNVGKQAYLDTIMLCFLRVKWEDFQRMPREDL